jgi:hypothetical protein
MIKKITKKKAVEKLVKTKVKTKIAKKAVPKPIGAITHFYGNIKVAIVKFKKDVKVGKKVRFLGATTDFEQVLKSIQYDHKQIGVAKKGKEIGVKVQKRVREGDEVYEA